MYHKKICTPGSMLCILIRDFEVRILLLPSLIFFLFSVPACPMQNLPPMVKQRNPEGVMRKLSWPDVRKANLDFKSVWGIYFQGPGAPENIARHSVDVRDLSQD